MMSDLGAQLPIDHHRVYASGFSNGAGFTARLAVERSTVLAAAAFSGGALPAAQAPARPISTYLTVGTLDDRVLAQTGPPPLTRLPLDPLALLAEPVIRSTVTAHVATLGLDAGDFGVISDQRSTSFRWPATGTGAEGAVMRFAVLDGLAHKYPNGRNNPAGFEAAPEFWAFFRTHRLPGAAGITARGRASSTHFTPPIGTDKGSYRPRQQLHRRPRLEEARGRRPPRSARPERGRQAERGALERDGELRRAARARSAGLRRAGRSPERRPEVWAETRQVPDSSECGQPYLGCVLRDLDNTTPEDHVIVLFASRTSSALRFGNGVYESVWNRGHIANVQIDVPETLSIGARGGFYEETGAFRDMVVTHLFQVLGFVAMEPPTSFSARALLDETVKVFHAMAPLRSEDVVRGQYAGYRDEPGVAADSTPRRSWPCASGSRTGAGQACRSTCARQADGTVAADAHDHLSRSAATDVRRARRPRAQPGPLRSGDRGGISASFLAKVPGPTMRLGPARLRFDYEPLVWSAGDRRAHRPDRWHLPEPGERALSRKAVTRRSYSGAASRIAPVWPASARSNARRGGCRRRGRT